MQVATLYMDIDIESKETKWIVWGVDTGGWFELRLRQESVCVHGL